MDDEYRLILGEVLSRKRVKAGLSKQQLALMVGLNRLTIRKIENGTANPSLNVLLRITAGIGISLADTFVECERILAGEDGMRDSFSYAREQAMPNSTIHYYLTKL